MKWHQTSPFLFFVALQYGFQREAEPRFQLQIIASVGGGLINFVGWCVR